jgi:oligopeptide/dipeptide ABC transporter ATP-binding protein
MRIGAVIREPLDVHRIGTPAEREARVLELLDRVGLGEDAAGRYPSQFSGGQRQRIGIARALATSPRFIVADEPISALDVSIQAQIVNLMADLQDELGLTYLFIAHDLAMVRHISDRVAVMYLGQIVEIGERDAVFDRPAHPYTRALIQAIPVPDPETGAAKLRAPLEGDVPSPADPPSGCRFHTRCPFASEICRMEEPRMEAAPRASDAPSAPGSEGDGHRVACHHADSLPKAD